jgi:hypothetical protein
MVKFKLEPDDCAGGVHTKPIPGKGNLGSARNEGTNQKYPVANGPQGKGGGHQLGPTGTTKGAGGTRIAGFGGAPKSANVGSLAFARAKSNPMKR